MITKTAKGVIKVSEEMKCICEGNWRSILSKTRPLFGKIFVDKDNTQYLLNGVMDAEDDYYFVFYDIGNKSTEYYSCVGSIEDFGFRLKELTKTAKEDI